jgi:hypothetical protein
LRPNQEKVRSTTQRRGRTDEALHVIAPLDDLHAQQRHLCHRSVNLPCVVAAVGPDQFEPREAPSYLVEHQPGAVGILDRGRVDNHPRILARSISTETRQRDKLADELDSNANDMAQRLRP